MRKLMRGPSMQSSTGATPPAPRASSSKRFQAARNGRQSPTASDGRRASTDNFTAEVRRREEADSWPRQLGPPPHVGGYDLSQVHARISDVSLRDISLIAFDSS